MSHQDRRTACARLNSANLLEVLQSLLVGVDWRSVRFRGDCRWSPRALAMAAILWTWSNESTLHERFFVSRRLILHLLSPVAGLASSYQAFMKVLRRWTEPLIKALQFALRKQLQDKLASRWAFHGWVAFGVDGSRMELPRTVSHVQAYAPSSGRPGKRKRSRRRSGSVAHARMAQVPHLWITTMFHVGTGLPWDWKMGPSDSSERAHALEMLPRLPERALLVADAGFIGYDFARTILDGGRELLLRVGSNVRLLRKLGKVKQSHHIVYFWPDDSFRKKQPPIVLRLVISQGPRHPIYLVTSILDQKSLSDEQVLELYHERWGIELLYRHLKQTFQYRKLRSHCAPNAAVELDWAMIGLWGLGFSLAKELATIPISLSRKSIAQALRLFRSLIRDYLHPAPSGSSWKRKLRRAITDSYPRRNKTSRDYPRKRKHKLIGPPTIVDASPQQKLRAKQIWASSQKG